MQTPLYNDHVALGARMVPFAGWELPLVYRGIIPEHLWTRAQASVFDVCHMGEFEIKGAKAEADLERLVTLSVPALKPGACAYGYLLAEDGGVQDDVICFRLGAFIRAMRELEQTARANPAALHAAPVKTAVGRLDEVAAARNMDLVFESKKK